MQRLEDYRRRKNLATFEKRGNYWPLIVPPACIGLWWLILKIAFNAKVANIFAIVASCALAIVVALAMLADALHVKDKLLHRDEPDEPDQETHTAKFS